MSKPPYRVPLMTEIAALPPNGFTVASSFSGCGGSSLGYRMAGFRVGWASEFIPAAADTYRANAGPGTVLDTRDIRTVQPEQVLEALGLEPGELDVWDGSPPCASFSTAGIRNAGWNQVRPYSDTRQRTDDLFGEYVRLVTGIQPRVFIAENVSGLVKGVAKGYFKEILAALKQAGYRVEARVLDASWLGVPQARQRLIFQGVRNDLGVSPAWPKPLRYQYTVRDALTYVLAQGDNGGFGGGGLRDSGRPSPTVGSDPGTGNGNFPPSVIAVDISVRAATGGTDPGPLNMDAPAPTVASDPDNGTWYGHQVQVIHDTSGQYGQGDVTDRPAPTITSGVHSVNSHHFQAPAGGLTRDPETGEDITIRRYAIGREWERLQRGQGRNYPNMHQTPEDRPMLAVTSKAGDVSAAGVTHWSECRKLTLGELRRLSGFPDDFKLTGSYSQRWERIGRAVPPVMMYHLAAAVRDRVLVPLRDAGRI